MCALLRDAVAVCANAGAVAEKDGDKDKKDEKKKDDKKKAKDAGLPLGGGKKKQDVAELTHKPTV